MQRRPTLPGDYVALQVQTEYYCPPTLPICASGSSIPGLVGAGEARRRNSGGSQLGSASGRLKCRCFSFFLLSRHWTR